MNTELIEDAKEYAIYLKGENGNVVLSVQTKPDLEIILNDEKISMGQLIQALTPKEKVSAEEKKSNRILWEMAEEITALQRKAKELPTDGVMWKWLEEDWFDWLEEKFNTYAGQQSDEISDFVLQMRKELQANNHKGNWKDYKPTIKQTESELIHHFNKFKVAKTDEERKEFLADCGNVIMFAYQQFLNREEK